MRGIEPIMPCITLNIVLRKYIDSFEFRNMFESLIGKFWLKKFGFVVPNIFVKF